jgi:hypothetical protein
MTQADSRLLPLTRLVTLPSGIRVRGRRLADPCDPVDFALVLAEGPVPAWPYRRILDAFHEAHRRAHAGERVEVACRGGIGRTGTALAALCILDGLAPRAAVTWVRGHYHPRAVETPGQRRWLRHVRLNTGP